MTNATLAVIGRTEIVLMVVGAIMILGPVVVALAFLWKWQRGRRAPPAKGS